MTIEKTIDLRKTIYDLCKQDINIPGILAEAGFSDIVKPGMIETAGRFMTIPKGMALKHIRPETIREVFARHGYTIEEGL